MFLNAGTQGASRFPILVWCHGGGWVIGDLDTTDGPPRHLCIGADCVAVSVDFPLAPETKFPGPDEDCYAATQWAVDNAAAINGGPARVAVWRRQRGGNLAAAISLMARDRNGPAIPFHLLLYPVIAPDIGTAYCRDYATGCSLTQDGMRRFWDQYLANRADAGFPCPRCWDQGRRAINEATTALKASFASVGQT